MSTEKIDTPVSPKTGDFVKMKTAGMGATDTLYRGNYAPAGVIGVVSYVYPKAYFYLNTIEDGKTLQRVVALKPDVEWEKLNPAELDAATVREFRFLGLGRTGLGVHSGSDPEVFVLGEKEKVIPAWDFLPSKETVMAGYGNPFWDGFQAEFTVQPNPCHAYLMDSIQYGLKKVLTAAKKTNPLVKLTSQSVVRVLRSTISRARKEYVQFGCAPSKNAYEPEVFPIPDGRHVIIRFAGCHMHFGHALLKSYENCISAVKALDATVGVMMVSLLRGLEDSRRRQFYGRAGEFRTPFHGLEWRVPSSTILCHPAVTHLCFDTARFATQFGDPQRTIKFADVFSIGSDDRIRSIINDYDVDEAVKVIDENAGYFKYMLNKLYPTVAARVFNAVREGVTAHLEIPEMDVAWKYKTGLGWEKHSGSIGASCSSTRWR